MRTLIYNLFFILLSINLLAQAPQAFKYQAVIRDGDGNFVSNQTVGLRITIHKAEVERLTVYQETHQAMTNDFGMVNLDVGYGIPVVGSMSAINWGSGYYMLELEVGPAGGTAYVSLGMSSILSVPYALYAKTSGSGGGGSLWEQNGDDIYYWDGNVGIRTNTPEFKLTLDDDGGILARGTYGSGATLASTGMGSKMIWYPRKAAFRAGWQLGSEWNDAMIGNYSIALGATTEASGDYSFASGWKSVASGQTTIAMGFSAEATENTAVAIGTDVVANGFSAMSIGRESSAENNYSLTLGKYLKASANGAIVVGSGTNTSTRLENSISNSLMIGFSDTPTMMVNDHGVGIGTTTFNANYTLQVKATSGSYAIVGESIDQGGVYGASTNSNGVFGFSANGYGVRASSFFGTALFAEHYGDGTTAKVTGKGVGDDAAVFISENTNGGVAAKFETNGNFPALIINQGGVGPLINGYSFINAEEVFSVSGNGRINLYNGDHTQTIKIDPYENGTTDGSAFSLYNGSGTRAILLDAAETGGADGSQTTLYNTYGNATIELDGNHQNGEGCITTNVLEITGGSDLAEPFDINSSNEVIPGMVVSIDPDHQGQLKVSEKAYDNCVAGIVSGAGKINTGLLLSQKGTVTEGEFPVALSGRVYCFASDVNGGIRPGDLLTTSDVAGHVMKSTDTEKSQGALIGKAMTGLENGTGLILVLVNLQ